MGRYFGYRMHPLSVAELLAPEADALVRPPAPLGAGAFADLLQFGGYPEPLLKADTRFLAPLEQHARPAAIQGGPAESDAGARTRASGDAGPN